MEWIETNRLKPPVGTRIMLLDCWGELHVGTLTDLGTYIVPDAYEDHSERAFEIMNPTHWAMLPTVPKQPKYVVSGGAIINRNTGVRIPDDEPIFILRARDRFAEKTLWEYARNFENTPMYDEIKKGVIAAFIEFRQANPRRMKDPTDETNP